MRKIITLDDYFPTGEQTVQPVLSWGMGHSHQDFSRLTKTASEALDYIKNVKPENGKTHLLLLALGGEETYGPNRNGDGFPERPVAARNKSVGRPYWVKPGEELTKHYQSFETNPAHVFKHHSNQDPSKASGIVKKAFWNPRMHRVELLVVIDNEKDAEWVQRVNDGEHVPVSMGCFTRGSRVLLSTGQYANIEDISVGNSVITHRGCAQNVTSTMVRPHRGTIYSVKAYGYRDPLILTGEHPLWLAPAESGDCHPSPTRIKNVHKQKTCTPLSAAKNGNCKGCTTTPTYSFKWVPTEDAREGDYLAMPLPTFKSDVTFTNDEARLLGYYLAEGHATHSNVRGENEDRYLVFSTGLHETETHKELYDLAYRLGAVSVTATDVEERNGKYINVWSTRLAQLCIEHCGEKAQTKRLSTALMGADTDTLKIFLGAYANGDGGAYKGSLYFSTASEGLAEQLRIVLARCRMIASVNKILHKPSRNSVVKVNTIEYQVWVGQTTATLLTTSRLPLLPADKPDNKRFFYEYEGTTYLVTKIKEIEELPYDDDVFNFSVANDESYLIDGLAVHNCKIKYDTCSTCGNDAPTRAQYCDHVKFAMNQLNADGTRNYVHNPSPSFFDISRVFRPADKTGYTLKKVAYTYELQPSAELGELVDHAGQKGAALRKISDIDKVLRGEPLASSSNVSPGEQAIIRQFRDYAAPQLHKSPNLPNKVLNKHATIEVLAAAAQSGIILKDAEFLQSVVPTMLGRAYDVPLSLINKISSAMPYVLGLYAESPALLDQILDSGAFDDSRTKVSVELGTLFDSYRAKRAYLGEMLYRRMVPEGVGLRRDAAPTTDVLNWTDPETGQTSQTTRGAAIDAQDEVTKSHVRKAIGGSALLLGGYKGLTAFPGLRSLKVPLAAGAGLLGYNTLKQRPGHQIKTDEGLEIPDITEFAPRQKMSSDNLTTAIIVNFIENYVRGPREKLAAWSTNCLKNSYTDSIRGLVHDADAVADSLGRFLGF